MIDPVYFAGIEFVTGSFTEITDDVLRMSIGRQLASPIDGLRPGEGSLIVDNFDGTYSPDNAGSSFAGLMRPQLPVRLKAIWPPGVNFTSNLVEIKRTSAMNNVVDSKVATLVLLIRKAADGANQKIFTHSGLSFQQALTDKFQLSGSGDSGSILVNLTNTTFAVSDGYLACCISVDMENDSKAQIYINDIDVSDAASTFIDEALNFDVGNWSIGAVASTADDFTGDIVFVWFDPTRKIDFSIEDNRRKFFDANNNPTPDLGDDGSLVTREKPAIFMIGDKDNFYKNRGYGGDFSITGTLEDTSDPEYLLFQGLIDEWSANPDLGRRAATIQCRDSTKRAFDRNVTTSLHTNFNIGSAFTEVLSLSGVNSFSIDTIPDEQPFIWFRDVKGSFAVDELIKEGYFFAFVDGGGTFNVKKRYYDILQDVVASLEAFKGLRYSLSDDLVFNDILVEGMPREEDPDTRTVGFIPDPILIPASDSVTFFLEFLDPDNQEPAPATGLVTPVNSTDYQLFTNSDGTGTELTSTGSASVTFFGQTAKNVVFNGNGDPAWLTRYGIRGQPVHRRARVTSQEIDDSSQAVYGDKTFRLSSDYLGKKNHNDDYATYLLERFKNPKADIQVTIQNEFPEILDAELADKAVLTDSQTGVASIYIIQELRHQIDLENGLMHTLRMDVTARRDSEVLILDDENWGKLDERRLGF